MSTTKLKFFCNSSSGHVTKNAVLTNWPDFFEVQLKKNVSVIAPNLCIKYLSFFLSGLKTLIKKILSVLHDKVYRIQCEKEQPRH